jgi:hypothetical protein
MRNEPWGHEQVGEGEGHWTEEEEGRMRGMGKQAPDKLDQAVRERMDGAKISRDPHIQTETPFGGKDIWCGRWCPIQGRKDARKKINKAHANKLASALWDGKEESLRRTLLPSVPIFVLTERRGWKFGTQKLMFVGTGDFLAKSG